MVPRLGLVFRGLVLYSLFRLLFFGLCYFLCTQHGFRFFVSFNFILLNLGKTADSVALVLNFRGLTFLGRSLFAALGCFGFPF